MAKNKFQLSKFSDSNDLQLSPIKINEQYREKWNIHVSDFFCLTKAGQLISQSLYRIGGLGGFKKDNYFQLLKYVEAIYDDIITRDKKRKLHLESRWVIIDKNGIEKVEFEQFDSPYLISNSVLYSIKGKYYNIETGEYYCDSSSNMQSYDFLFLENRYGCDKDESKIGIMKINKKDGSWELFPDKK